MEPAKPLLLMITPHASGWMSHWRRYATTVKTEFRVYQRVYRHPDTPRISRWLLGLALAYLLSPLDLIPDWLPLIGQLDDLIIVPLLVYLALRQIPPELIAQCRALETQAK